MTSVDWFKALSYILRSCPCPSEEEYKLRQNVGEYEVIFTGTAIIVKKDNECIGVVGDQNAFEYLVAILYRLTSGEQAQQKQESAGTQEEQKEAKQAEAVQQTQTTQQIQINKEILQTLRQFYEWLKQQNVYGLYGVIVLPVKKSDGTYMQIAVPVKKYSNERGEWLSAPYTQAIQRNWYYVLPVNDKQLNYVILYEEGGKLRVAKVQGSWSESNGKYYFHVKKVVYLIQ